MNSTATVQNSNFCPPKSTYAGKRKKKQRKRNDQNVGPTALFTHLKIILLQCFQFSIFSFSKISSIQTDPYNIYARQGLFICVKPSKGNMSGIL